MSGTPGSSAWATLKGSAAVAADWWGVSHAAPAASRRAGGRHVAFLAWALPPNTNAGVHRPLSFLRHGTPLGWRFSTFQGETPGNQAQHGEELLAKLPPTVRRTVVAGESRPVSWRLFPRIDGGFADAIAFARVALEALRDDPPDVVLASGPPFHTFVAARWLARAFGVPLVLDYRDEWSECPFDFVSAGPDDRRWERECLREAAAVLFTTESHRTHQLRTFAELTPDRAHVVANGWEPEDFGPLSAPGADGGVDRGAVGGADDGSAPHPSLRLAHVGTLSGHTSPVAFLQRLDELIAADPAWRHALNVEFIGRRSPAADDALRAAACFPLLATVDHVPKREAARRMQTADALLLLCAPELERYLPGKLFDYVAAGRPVLVFGSEGESSRALSDVGLGVFCPAAQPGALGQALMQLRQRRHAPLPPAVQPWLQAHRRDVLARQAFSLIEAACAGAGAKVKP
jgi:hypothetical protein